MEEILDEYGWPGWSLVGEDGALAAWVLIQHADLRLPLQKRGLALLTAAVAANDAAAVAALVDDPFATLRDGQPLKIADAEAFVRDYDRIMTPPIAEAIKRQRYSELMVNYKGVMFGNGEAWVNGICRDDACKNVDVRVVALQPAS